jgi:hypothetical protein
MTSYIVEHMYKGQYVMETISGVEDIDTTLYKNLLGIWVCDTQEEVQVMEKQLKEMRHARSGQPS